MKAQTMVLAAAVVLVAASAFAKGVTVKEAKPGLLRQATVTAADATAIAQACVPKAKIVSAEIEEEGGKLLYSFEMRTGSHKGVDEVNIDAVTGKKVDRHHETPADEAKEKAADNSAGESQP